MELADQAAQFRQMNAACTRGNIAPLGPLAAAVRNTPRAQAACLKHDSLSG